MSTNVKQFSNNLLQIIFLGLFLLVFHSPVNTAMHIDIAGIKISYSEIAFIILPILNLLVTKSESIQLHFKLVKKYILLFIGYIVLIEFFKQVIFYGSISDFIKSVRLSVPLISSLIIIYSGLRINIKYLWFTLLSVIILSSIISVLAFVFGIDQYLPPGLGYGVILQGRVFNSNSSFGIIALFLLFESKKIWYNKGWFPTIAALFGVFGLILSGNRTYLISMLMLISVLLFRNYSIKVITRGFIFLVTVGVASILIYSSNPIIKRQVDKRIKPIFISGETVYTFEEAYYGSREFIVDGVLDKIEKNHWIIGLPYSEAIFDYGYDIYIRSGRGEMKMTDTSFINLMLRYGFLSVVLFLILFFQIYKENYYSSNRSRIFVWTFPIFFFASINIDSLVSHNSIFFISICLFVTEKVIIRNKIF